jgi:glycerol-3-phosphate dehydrogenase
MEATSRASSKLLHGGLRYLENGEFHLVREALRERDAWIRRAPHLARPIRLVLPIYRGARPPRWMVALGLFAYDRIAGRTDLPKANWLTAIQLMDRDPALRSEDLSGGYEFSDAQMDDHALGLWVAEQARSAGVTIREGVQVHVVSAAGGVTVNGETLTYDRIVNVAGPWAVKLLEQSGLHSPFRLDAVRGSHLTLATPFAQPYLLEIPDERRIFFVLPWKGATLVGTTEVRQSLDEPIACTDAEQSYLLAAYRQFFPTQHPVVTGSFAGLRPLIHSANELSRMTREYMICQQGSLVTVLGGKWTTAMALAGKVSRMFQ